MGFAEDHGVKIKENKKIDIYLDLTRELKKCVEYEDKGNANCNQHSWNGSQRLVEGTEGLEISGRIENIQITALLR